MSVAERSAHNSGSNAGLLVAAIAPLVVSWALGCLLIPQFAMVFTGFGADLPWTTHLVLRYHPYAIVLVLLILAVWQLWPHRETSGTAALIFGIVLTAALWCFCLYSMYAPIFALGASVG